MKWPRCAPPLSGWGGIAALPTSRERHAKRGAFDASCENVLELRILGIKEFPVLTDLHGPSVPILNLDSGSRSP